MKKNFLSLITIFYTSLGFAQEGQELAQQAPAPWMQFVPFVLIFGVFYLFVIRPQQKRFKEEQEMINKLKKGDEIFTKAGLIGTIHGMTDKVVTLEVSEGMKIKVLRSQIGGSAKSIFENKTQGASA